MVVQCCLAGKRKTTDPTEQRAILLEHENTRWIETDSPNKQLPESDGDQREPGSLSQLKQTSAASLGAACPAKSPEHGSHGASQARSCAPLTHVPFLHQGCGKSRSLNNIAGAAGTSLGLSPPASRYSSPYPPRKPLLAHPFHPLTSPPPGHSAS